PDAPTPQPWVHWVLYKIPPTLTGLPAGIAGAATLNDPRGALQGQNSFSKIGYNGPMPPRGHGLHHYHFKLYALDQPLPLAPGLSKEAVLAAMRGHVIGEGELIGTYERK
ncbi:MAG: YbhB/YbcL family Raf kinase inhibitor-like protein, partial [Phycisphaerae bacterium]